MTIAQSIDSSKDTRPSVDVGVMPFDMPERASAIFRRALEAEQWLQRIGLHGLVTGIANPDMQEFGRACSTLVERFKASRAQGFAEGHAAAVRRYKSVALAAACLGVIAGVALGALLSG